MTHEAIDLHDNELDAAVDASLATDEPAYKRGCSITAAHCAGMLTAYIDAHLGGFVDRTTAAGLRELAGSMLRMGDRP